MKSKKKLQIGISTHLGIEHLISILFNNVFDGDFFLRLIYTKKRYIYFIYNYLRFFIFPVIDY